MASKKAKKKTLPEEISAMSDRLGALTTALERPGGLVQKLEQVCALLDLAVKRQEDIKNFLGRVVAPEEALNALTGELRVFRHLMDKAGEFKALDRVLAQREKLASAAPLAATPTGP